MNVFIKAETVKEACMQVDLFAPKESGTVELKPSGPGWLATYRHTPACKTPPLVVVNGRLDEYVKQLVARNVSSAISWWLLGSFAYYMLDETLFSDELFDELNELIIEHYDTIEHVNKDMVTPERLSAGSAFDIRVWPLRVESSVQHLLRMIASTRP